MSNSERTRRGRQELPRNGKIRAGEKLTLSGMNKVGTSKYIDDIDTSMPEKLRAKKSKEHTPMKSVKSSYNERRPQSISNISLDTGDVEVGYDNKRQNSILSFVHRTNTQRSREINEENVSTKSMKNNVQLDSNDRYFYGGAIAMRVDAENTNKKIASQLGEVSHMNGGQSTVDEVIPFMDDKQETNRLKSLYKLEHSELKSRTEIGTAITALHMLINTKKQRKVQFLQNLNDAVGELKEVRSNDDFYLLLKKKKLQTLEEMMQDIDTDLFHDSEISEKEGVN